jgi:membrane protein DedA with SNARE-associated domain
LDSSVLQWVAHYGYFAIYTLLVLGIIGLPVPDEFLLAGCGFLVFQGHLRLVPAFASALAGSMSGITGSYIIGRTLGWKFLHSRLGRLLRIKDEHIRRVHDWFDRIGHWALLVGYFIPGVRHFTAIVAGTSKIEVRSFALFAYTGALFWVSTFLFIGYHFGQRWPEILALVEHHLKLASAAAGVVLVAYAIYLLLNRKRGSEAPPG